MTVGTQLRGTSDSAPHPDGLAASYLLIKAQKQGGLGFISPSFKKKKKKIAFKAVSFFFFPAAPIIPFVQSKILQFEAFYLFCPSRVYNAASEQWG